MKLHLESPAFRNSQMIPVRCTCDGEDRSPELVWSGAPPATASFAIVCDDPDAPRGDWVHWVLFDLPPEATRVPEGVPPSAHPPAGGVHGKNSWGRLGYGGPCPPSGTHRYFFTLYALDRRLGLHPGAAKLDVLAAGQGHVLDTAELMGRYRRTKG
jgi:Raf kinase inhibitor-like YbhB/YbcL family protein